MAQDAKRLRRVLNGAQLFFIVLSSVIGTGVFSTNGEALELAGPAGLLLTVTLVGFFAAFVGETVGELVQAFPVPNAIFEYVSAFVDEELAWVVTFAYWYTFAVVFPSQMMGAAKLTKYWSLTKVWRAIIFYGILPCAFFVLNLLRVEYFGWIETVGGALKFVLVIGVSIILYRIAAVEGWAQDGPISDGLQYDERYASTLGGAFSYALPSVAFGYLGLETTVIAAFEARDARSIAVPARILPWAVLAMYFLCTLGIALTVKWDDEQLPGIIGPRSGYETNIPRNELGPNSSSVAVIIAITNKGWDLLASFVNGCLVFSVLSAANTALYVSSRTLYGMTYNLKKKNYITRKLQGLSKIVDKTRVPARALVVSFIAFYWLPWLHLTPNSGSIEASITILGQLSSLSCMIVWACICLAYIRFRSWTRVCEPRLRETPELSRYICQSPEYSTRTWMFLSFGQPYVAWLGLIGCLMVFILMSATFWDAERSPVKIIEAYGAHVVLLVFWLVLKVIKYFRTGEFPWWVSTNAENSDELIRKLRALHWLSEWNDESPTDIELRGPTSSTSSNDGRAVPFPTPSGHPGLGMMGATTRGMSPAYGSNPQQLSPNDDRYSAFPGRFPPDEVSELGDSEHVVVGNGGSRS